MIVYISYVIALCGGISIIVRSIAIHSVDNNTVLVYIINV